MTAHLGLAEQPNRGIRFRQRAIDVLEADVVRVAIDQQCARCSRAALADDGDRQAEDRALTEPDTAIRLFGKPEVRGHRRMGVSLALGATIEEARAKARKMTAAILEGVKCA
jgi:formate-dependent phosphoribosylglycinamide formyltransferase (GAR transformylase)